MKLSTRGRYGVKAMVDLAIHYGDAPVSIKSISSKTKYFRILFRTIIFSIKKSKAYNKYKRGSRWICFKQRT